MLTDDELTQALGSAYRSDTRDLHYRGRVPSPRPTAIAVLPAAGFFAVAAVGGVAVATSHSGSPAQTGPTTAPSVASPSVTTTAPGRVDVELSAYLRQLRAATGGLHSVAHLGTHPRPADARRVDTPGNATAYVGKDPDSGDTALWVTLAGSGKESEITSPDASENEITDLITHPAPVPAVP